MLPCVLSTHVDSCQHSPSYSESLQSSHPKLIENWHVQQERLPTSFFDKDQILLEDDVLWEFTIQIFFSVAYIFISASSVQSFSCQKEPKLEPAFVFRAAISRQRPLVTFASVNNRSLSSHSQVISSSSRLYYSTSPGIV